LDVGARRLDRARARDRMEVRVAEPQRDATRLDAALAGAMADALAEAGEHRLGVAAAPLDERPLVRDAADALAARIVLLECRALSAEVARASARRRVADRRRVRAEDRA